MGGHRGHEHRACTDAAVASHRDGPEHLGAAEDRDRILDRRMALATMRTRAPERDALVDGHVVADLSGLTDHHGHTVIDEEAPTDLRPRMNLDAGQEAAEVAHEPARGPEAARPEPVSDAIDPQRMEPRIG